MPATHKRLKECPNCGYGRMKGQSVAIFTNDRCPHCGHVEFSSDTACWSCGWTNSGLHKDDSSIRKFHLTCHPGLVICGDCEGGIKRVPKRELPHYDLLFRRCTTSITIWMRKHPITSWAKVHVQLAGGSEP